MSEYAGRIAIGVSIVVVVSVVFAFELNYFLPANVATSSSQSTSIGTSSPVLNGTSWFGSGAPPGGCADSTLTGFALYKGYRLDVYTPSQVVAPGSSVCILSTLQNLDNQSASLPANETLTVTNPLVPGVASLQSSCEALSFSGSFGPNDTSWNCAAVWNTPNAVVRPANFTSPPSGYQLMVVVRFANSSTVISLGSNFGLGQEPIGSTTTRVTSASAYQCGSPGTFMPLTPIGNSSLYLKVVTDSGSIINFNNLPNNGTIFVTHALPAGVNTTASTVRNFCLRLENNDNSTGYMSLVGNESLPAVGSYYLTLIAGYANGPGYSGNIPTITVGPNSTVYVTISVPSGEVTIVSCASGNNCITTTTTATALSGG